MGFKMMTAKHIITALTGQLFVLVKSVETERKSFGPSNVVFMPIAGVCTASKQR